MLAAFVHEAHIYSRVNSALQVKDMGMRVVRACKDHSRVGGHLKVEFVEDALTFVDFAELLVEVLGDLEGLHGLGIIPDIPNVHGQVVSGEKVIVACWSKFGHSNRVDYFCEKMLPRGILLQFNLRSVVSELGRYA